MLYNRDVRQKWARRDVTKAANWAAMPKAPTIVTVVPAADSAETLWRFTTENPGEDWSKPGFDDKAWKESPAGFGAGDPPGASIRTPWNTSDIWIRRKIDMPASTKNLQLWLHHDEDAEVYLNGVLAVHVKGYTTSYDVVPMLPAAREQIKPGAILVAIHCHQTTGGQYIDAGFVRVIEEE